MALSSVELEVWTKMMALLAVLVAGMEGLAVVAMVVVVEDPFLEAKGQVAVEEVGIVVLEARIQMSA